MRLSHWNSTLASICLKWFELCWLFSHLFFRYSNEIISHFIVIILFFCSLSLSISFLCCCCCCYYIIWYARTFSQIDWFQSLTLTLRYVFFVLLLAIFDSSLTLSIIYHTNDTIFCVCAECVWTISSDWKCVEPLQSLFLIWKYPSICISMWILVRFLSFYIYCFFFLVLILFWLFSFFLHLPYFNE